VSGLAALQRDFLRELLDAESGSTARVDVYRRGARANHAGALAATYPVVKRLVGDAFFGEAARRYAAAHPSTSGDLNDYGGPFAAFLAAYPHAASLPYLPDVARLEWACHECERAPDAPPFDFAALAGVAPERYAQLRFTLHPSVRLVESVHPIVSIHAANAPECDGTPRRTQGAERALVHRDGAHARVLACAPSEFELLYALARGEPLAGVEMAPDALAHWVAHGVISAFAAPPCAR
jgi:hypothetical protein